MTTLSRVQSGLSWPKLPRALAASYQAAVEFLFPPACVRCGTELGADLPAPAFCQPCDKDLTVRVDACFRCGASIGPNLNPDGCPRCRDEGFKFERVIRLGVYKGVLASACLEAKRPHREPVAAALAQVLWRLEEPQFRSSRCDLVVPVPRYWLDRWRHRHSAPNILAEVWAHHMKLPLVPQVLQKTRSTPRQAKLTPTKRGSNLRGAFAARGWHVEGASILLVDDILTTGNTANECSKALLKAGAARVVVAVIARGLGRDPVPPASFSSTPAFSGLV